MRAGPGDSQDESGAAESSGMNVNALLQLRANLLRRTRNFFEERGVLEVETPLLARGLIVDANIDPVACEYRPNGSITAAGEGERLFLQPSPEAPMKRLLVAGSGPIYQFARSFRDGELGHRHQPEFTMLEWYRPGMDHHGLIEEVGALVCELLQLESQAASGSSVAWEKISYADLFQRRFEFDPFDVSIRDLQRAVDDAGVPTPMGLDDGNRNGWLDLLMSTCIEPNLGSDGLVFVLDYPPSQAALARIGGTGRPVAERFELYYRGVELANGYNELLDPREHRLRFRDANVRRTGLRKEALPIDDDFIADLEQGLPECAGVALGFDRLVMLAAGCASIDDVLPFPFQR